MSTAKTILESEKLLSQRQLLVPLWTYITSMDETNPEEVIEPNVHKSINALELIALRCEGGMIDKEVFWILLMRIFHFSHEVI